MSEDINDSAPSLGQPIDAAVDDDTADFLMKGGRPDESPDAAADGEQTIDTPDELGGTGGVQEGGAG
jgi:hypothetical protein